MRSAGDPGLVIQPTSRVGVIRIGTENFSAHSATDQRRGTSAYFFTNSGIVPRTAGASTNFARPCT